MKKDLTNLEAFVGLAIWGVGVGVIYLLWQTRVFVHDFMESLLGFALYVVAFFYFLALPWCFELAKKVMRGQSDDND